MILSKSYLNSDFKAGESGRTSWPISLNQICIFVGGVTVHLSPDSQKYVFLRGTRNAVWLTHCVYLFVAFKVLSPHRQTAGAKSTDKQCLFPSYAKHFTILVFSLQEDSWCNPNWKPFWDLKELHLSMFGFRSSRSNMGNVLATNSLHYYRLHNVIPIFFYETVDLTEPWWKMWSLQGEIALHKHISH